MANNPGSTKKEGEIKFNFDKAIFGISVLSLIIFAIFSGPMFIMARIKKEAIYPFYIFTLTALIVYLAVALVKITDRLLGNRWNIEFETPLSTDFTTILLGILILLVY